MHLWERSLHTHRCWVIGPDVSLHSEECGWINLMVTNGATQLPIDEPTLLWTSIGLCRVCMQHMRHHADLDAVTHTLTSSASIMGCPQACPTCMSHPPTPSLHTA